MGAITEEDYIGKSVVSIRSTQMAQRCGLFSALLVQITIDGFIHDWQIEEVRNEFKKGLFKLDADLLEQIKKKMKNKTKPLN